MIPRQSIQIHSKTFLFVRNLFAALMVLYFGNSYSKITFRKLSLCHEHINNSTNEMYFVFLKLIFNHKFSEIFTISDIKVSCYQSFERKYLIHLQKSKYNMYFFTKFFNHFLLYFQVFY